VANGSDPALERDRIKASPTVAALFEEYDRLHTSVKLKGATRESYRSLFKLHISGEWGSRKAENSSALM
jgi:hypothetical protein